MRIAAAFLLTLLTACSGPRLMVPASEETDPPGTDEVKVVIYRDSFRNATKPYAVLDNEEMIGFSQSGSWFEARLTTGDHLLFLHGVSSSGVRATLEAGKTYYLRVESVPTLFRLRLRLTPIEPDMPEFDRIDEILAGLQHREPVDSFVVAYLERHADELEAELSRLQTEGREECAVMSPEAGK